jgi:hypothetical protein
MAQEAPGGGVVGGSGSNGGVATASDLPCDIDQILASSCRSCHGATPTAGAPMSLVTYANLSAPAKSDPSKSVAALCVARITSTSAPMPPTPPLLSAADIATFQSWVAAGLPQGSCSSAVDPLGAAPICTSGQTWNNGNQGSQLMNPGLACIACHSSGEGPRYNIAGTVYPTGHEPDRCDGTSAAQVIITDAAGKILTLTPNAAGNFFARATLTLPYTAKVMANGATRAMSEAQTSGDCNSCHTQNGLNGAPGRVTLP